MNNQTQSKMFSFFNKRVSTRAGIAIIMVAFFICSVILIWQAQLLKQETKALEIVLEIAVKPEIIIKDKIIESKIIKASFDSEKLIFLNFEGKKIKEINAEKFIEDLREFLKLSEMPSAIPTSSIIIAEKAIENPGGIFYFFATTLDYCGASGNCSWVFYKFNSENQQFLRITKDRYKDKVSGSFINYYISPDKENVAVIHSSSAGICIQNNHITVINLNELKFQKVKGFEDNEYSVNTIESLEWLNNATFKFSVVQFKCEENQPSGNKWHREFNYYLSSQKIELIKEELWITAEDETADWKTYKNEEYGFEVKYPNDWDHTIIGKYNPQVFFGPQNVIKDLKLGKEVNDKSLGVIVSAYDKILYERGILPYRGKSTEYIHVTSSEVSVDNVKGTYYISEYLKGKGDYKAGEKTVTVDLPINDTYLSIHLFNYQYLDIFENILSTFRFLE